MNTRIFIADDHEMIIEGIRGALNSYMQYQVVDYTTKVGDVMYKVKMTNPDIIILDLSMPHIDSLHLLPKLKKQFPNLKILIYTMHKESWIIQKLMSSKVDSYINKTSPITELIKAIKKLSENGTYFPNDIMDLLFMADDQQVGNYEVLPNLTRREKQVLKLILQEYKSKDIAVMLNISINTVETHRKNLMAKFQVKNIAGLVRQAYEKGLV